MTSTFAPLSRHLGAKRVLTSLFLALALPWAAAQTPAQVHELAKAQTQPLLGTLKDLVSIESGSRDLDGLEKVANLVAGRLQQMGMTVQTIPTQAPATHPQLKGAKLGSVVLATQKGKGQKKVLLIAHMDTVYLKGMVAKQPFRIDGNEELAIVDRQPVIVGEGPLLQAKLAPCKCGAKDFDQEADGKPLYSARRGH